MPNGANSLRNVESTPVSANNNLIQATNTKVPTNSDA